MGLFSGLKHSVGSIASGAGIGALVGGPAGALIGAGLGAASGSFSGAAQQKNANEMAMQSWQLMNDYNHPIQQMERLKAAGLNPLLVYGSGSVTGNTTSAPALTGGNVSTGLESLAKVSGKALGLLQGQATLDQTNASAMASRAAAGASGAQASNLNAQAALTETRNRYEEKSLIADLDYKKALAEKTRQETKKVSAEADIAQGEASIFGAVGGAKTGVQIGKGAGTLLKSIRGVFGR